MADSSSPEKCVVAEHQGSGRRGQKVKQRVVTGGRKSMVGRSLGLPMAGAPDDGGMRHTARVQATPSPFDGLSKTDQTAITKLVDVNLLKKLEMTAAAELKAPTLVDGVDAAMKAVLRQVGVLIEPDIVALMLGIYTAVKDSDGRMRDISTVARPRVVENATLALRLMVDPDKLQEFMLRKTPNLPRSTVPSNAWSPEELARFEHDDAFNEARLTVEDSPANGPIRRGL
jgi:hypothetical protein